VKWAEEVGDEFSVVGDVFETANRFELACQMIGDFAYRSVRIERAVPGATIVVIEAIATWTRMRECSVDECEACSTKYELPRIQLRKSTLLREQATVCSALKLG
jgi:hypothetical protein